MAGAYETPNKMLQSASELNLPESEFRKLSAQEWRHVLARVFDTFADTSDTNVSWLWEHLKRPGVSFQADDTLCLLDGLVEPDARVWLIVEDDCGSKRHGNYWVFAASYRSALSVLGNMFSIEFYLIAQDYSWMVLENHHSFVVAVGEPVESRLLAFSC